MGINVGVLAFQGAFKEHKDWLDRCSCKSIEVRTLQDIAQVTHLIIPGGESTVIGKELRRTGMDEVISERFGSNDLKLLGTCAGAILMGNSDSEYSMGLIDVDLKRNAYGAQVHSFASEIDFEGSKMEAVFIRAPIIDKCGESVKVLACQGGKPVLCADENIMISTFHPELTDSPHIAKYFLNL
ncbi:pyridoxal 5'-phosphate synthase glutaminase subunit PdxT [Candidatus Peregrinibacteria bacterium]|nr:pyridoxal 5'-phosphate synthase glutaminase subunit PdxT [Candidatus Peregrinibacteria bacterium]